MKPTRKAISDFLSSRKLAVAGVSRDPKKFGYEVFKSLREKGFEVFPVNPDADLIDGTPCFKDIASLPVNIHNLLIVTKKSVTEELVRQALTKGIDHIWIQQGSSTPQAIALTKAHKVNLVTGQCIFMHTEPVTGVHKFHRTIRKLFGLMPK
jgi:predicted CoA-binding protein